jgi:hypothetical protein
MTVSKKRKQAGSGKSRRQATRVSTILDVRGVGKKTSKQKSASGNQSKAKSAKQKKAGTRVSTILDTRAAGKKAASSRRANQTRDGK